MPGVRGKRPGGAKKKHRREAVERGLEKAQGQVTVGQLCHAVGITRQGYYKGTKVRRKQEIDQQAVAELVMRERQLQPFMGTRKLLEVLRPELCEMGIKLGRDRLFDVLRAKELLLEPRRRSGPRTTDSRHGLRVYPNLVEDLQLTGPHQAWVSDITYVRTLEGWLYAFLISDKCSRKIVGCTGEATLEAEGGLRALAMAIKQLPRGAKPIHHSDRGKQYCCGAYVKRLTGRGLTISMTADNHCYENAQAERLNGILKQEYGLGGTFRTRAEARKALAQAVWLYNTRRPHVSLSYRIPALVHEAA